MSGKKNHEFRRCLTPEQVAAGMNAAARNAQRLYDDAALLADARRFPSACALAVLSIEEAGKLPVLRRIACCKNDDRAKEIWRDYRNHRVKNAAWIIVDLAMKGARTIEDLQPIVDPQSDHPAVLDTIKQISLYTDCYGAAHWSEPHEVIDGELCRSILRASYALIPRKPATRREIELWIEHVGDGAENVHGVAAFFQAMRDEGLADHDPADIAQFLALGSSSSKPASH